MTAPDTAALARLRKLQWSFLVHGRGRACPICRGLEQRGHTTNCSLAAALSSASSQDAGDAPNPAVTYAHSVTLPYTNWRGEHAMRTLSPIRLFWGSNEWHPEPQWLIEAWDLDKSAIRVFALSGFGAAPQPEEPAAKPDGVTFQARVDPWLIACFGETIARDRMERNHRFIEEALELVQSNGCTAAEAHQLVDYVYGCPAGDPAQEVGGVMNTLAALCLASGLDMHEAGESELARVWTKVEQIRAKQAAKPKHSPLPDTAPPALPRAWRAGGGGANRAEAGDGG